MLVARLPVRGGVCALSAASRQHLDRLVDRSSHGVELFLQLAAAKEGTSQGLWINVNTPIPEQRSLLNTPEQVLTRVNTSLGSG